LHVPLTPQKQRQVRPLEKIVLKTQINNPQLWLSHLPKLLPDGNKYTRGHALIYGGYPITGAARIAARACARIGSGLTTIAVPEIAFPIYATSLTSIMVRPVAASYDFKYLLEDNRLSAFLIGPGAGKEEHIRTYALAMLATGKPTVLDADAINIFANEPLALRSAISGPCVITPHEGEFARLFDNSSDRLISACKAAKQSGAIIVLKGNKTVIADPDGRVIINKNAPPTLATAGSGDVLSGIILGLLAQGMEPFLAAAASVWLHGAAATQFGPCLIAEDLPDMLPDVFRSIYHSITQPPPSAL